jgi:hypothetical protein
MTDRFTLSIMRRHPDGTSTSLLWSIDPQEAGQVEDLLERPCDISGLITDEQARQARDITSSWLTCKNHGSGSGQAASGQ